MDTRLTSLVSPPTAELIPLSSRVVSRAHWRICRLLCCCRVGPPTQLEPSVVWQQSTSVWDLQWICVSCVRTIPAGDIPSCTQEPCGVGGLCCNGPRHKWMGHHNWTAWTTCFKMIVACVLKWRSRTGHRSLNLHVHERAGRRNFCNRTLMCSTRELFALGRQPCAQGNPTQMVEHTILVGGLRDVHHQPKRTHTAGLARHETGVKVTGNGRPKNP